MQTNYVWPCQTQMPAGKAIPLLLRCSKYPPIISLSLPPLWQWLAEACLCAPAPPREPSVCWKMCCCCCCCCCNGGGEKSESSKKPCAELVQLLTSCSYVPGIYRDPLVATHLARNHATAITGGYAPVKEVGNKGARSLAHLQHALFAPWLRRALPTRSCLAGSLAQVGPSY
jgi:hypothetical protein